MLEFILGTNFYVLSYVMLILMKLKGLDKAEISGVFGDSDYSDVLLGQTGERMFC